MTHHALFVMSIFHKRSKDVQILNVKFIFLISSTGKKVSRTGDHKYFSQLGLHGGTHAGTLRNLLDTVLLLFLPALRWVGVLFCAITCTPPPSDFSKSWKAKHDEPHLRSPAASVVKGPDRKLRLEDSRSESAACTLLLCLRVPVKVLAKVSVTW